MTIRNQVIYSVVRTEKTPGFRSDMVRHGEPNQDMSSVEVSYRAISFTITPAERDHIMGSREVQISPQVALDLSRSLADAANILIKEQKNDDAT